MTGHGDASQACCPLGQPRPLRIKRLYPGTILKPATRTVLVPIPTGKTLGSPQIVGAELLVWTRGVIDALVPAAAPSAQETTPAPTW